MKNTITLTLAGFVGLALSSPVLATDVHTRTIASTCMSCHGPNGRSLGTIPSLTGMNKENFVKLMQGYKSGTRLGTIMKRHASGYTDAEFESMGAYFASLK
ncbi:MAG: c-type cytochrome [Thiobacillus sp.]